MPCFNQLIQPPSTVTPSAPSRFDPAIALVLGNACNLTYTQYATNSPSLSKSQIETAMGNEGAFEPVGSGFTSSETIGIGDSQGNYRTVPIGFSMKCTPSGGSLPLYITGHSLGVGLAVICAMDVGTNFPNCYPGGQLNMWNLVGPLVAAGVNFEKTSLSPSVFIESFDDVVDCSFRIVNTADIVPILPPSSLGMGGFGMEFAHITENNVSYCNQIGSIADNHSCTGNYVAYLAGLAKGYS